MYNCIISERIKIRHTFLKVLFFAAPLVTSFISLFLASNYAQIDNFNWWYGMIMPGMLTIACTLSAGIDKKLKDQAVLVMPVKIKHIWYAKTAVMAVRFAISCLLILIVSFVEGILFKDTGYPLVSNLSMLAGTALMIITSLWQIPLCMFLGYKIGIFPTFIINLAAYIVFSATVSLSNWWMAVPYTYTARLMIPAIGILPNGLMAEPGSYTFTPELLSKGVFLPGIILSLLLFAVITYLTGRWYKNREAQN
ncbi:lantibiotic immunity ABC transporter MutE/EpiE family permease subunit [Robinsoniella peoriensis]|uniref:Lantibiotic protection ABC transporter permease subunit, MutE/EpiE family n=1 Tax=Robinsoniella peoriensis TaxID=180332 RepID=A0A4V6HRC0_9FIRM|nr:lantibiotic immunity ABC transporter MutE/EpiE family permease subunit [Robinsoniella peoriensis]MDU7031888.1 lantibiotic immunity ABC transporter MutE/EpiE family permease subunit [Clostridiales bacterium]TLC98457.1 lantibiotic protection ABC transporter permease subunit, MutE/EpiE family [Robinsoniella peoriensis]